MFAKQQGATPCIEGCSDPIGLLTSPIGDHDPGEP